MPVTPVYPGVYIEETPAPMSPIAPIPTGIAAFVGSAKKGTVNHPVRVFSFDDFQLHFGPLVSDILLGYAVRQFFANGGKEAIIVRIPKQPSPAKILVGIHALDAIDNFDLLVIPGITIPAILTEAAHYCQQHRAFLIIDPPENLHAPAEIEVFIQSQAFLASPNAALYFPWTTVSDPLNNGHPRPIPPSGTIAGIIARTDATRGVWKSPAGPEAMLIGVKSLDILLTDDQSATLNTLAINTLRTFRTFGLVAWGARTLAGSDALASEWKYIAVRRLALFIEASIQRGTQWASFEPNAEPLWSRLRQLITDFLQTLFQRGAFTGTTPRDAFFVKCGADTISASDLESGLINVEIGIAPLRPAEFTVLRLRLFTA